MAIARDYIDVVQGIYLAYYGRFADQNGLSYWTNTLVYNGGNLAGILNAFGTSAEATAMLAGKTTAQQVNAIYQTLFGRDVDPTGLTYYTNLITSGEATLVNIAKRIWDGATSGTDKAYLDNKILVANELTPNQGAQASYSGNAVADAARTLMKTVTADPATKATAIANATSTLATATATLAAGSTPVTYIDGGGNTTNHFQVGDTIMFNFNKAIASITSATINDAGVTTSHTHTFGSTLVISNTSTSAYVVLGSATTVAANDTVTIVGVDQSGTSASITFTLA